LQALLPARGGEWLALSRWPQPEIPGVQWLQGSLEAMPAQALQADTIISLGPLDAFATWFNGADARAQRVIALGSAGRADKLRSADPAERALAERLANAEASLHAAAARRGVALTLLRPSLIYGGVGDRSLTPMLERARRWGFLALPGNASGLRQPVHAADVAAAVFACLDTPVTAGRAYDLPGGETLAFGDMVRRALKAHAPGCRLVRLPAPLFGLAARLARFLDSGAPGPGVISRLGLDQVADAGPAQRDFSYTPRAFQP
jgi:nucleoside-diphosphate-sugar epimerase